jgi:predicted DNA-binding transcriptional regulator YafY
MRADRLIAILLLLQRRGRVTAAEVAEELEISERTARRDLDALGVAGLPIVSFRGRQGGWELLGGGSLDLSGLTASEVHALFAAAGAPVDATPQIRAALRKLTRALPEPQRDPANAALGSVLVDPTDWDRRPRRSLVSEHLPHIQDAVVQRRVLRLTYVRRDRTRSVRDVHPLGIVAKGSIRYLVADTDEGRRTFRIDRISDVLPTDQPARRPDGFNLEAAWEEIRDRIGELRAPLVVHGHVATAWLPVLKQVFGERMTVGEPIGEDRVAVTWRASHVAAFVAEIAGFVEGCTVTEPIEVCGALARLGDELRNRYRAEADDRVVW